MNKFVFLDFEFNDTVERDVNLVCLAVRTVNFEGGLHPVGGGCGASFWLEGNAIGKVRAKRYLANLHKQGAIFVAYAAEAEARSLFALGIDPIDIRWIDLYVEYRMLLNHNHTYSYGEQLMDGKIRYTKPPKKYSDHEESEDELIEHAKPHYGLASAAFKLLGVRIDTRHKDEMRDAILSKSYIGNKEIQDSILEYCKSDVKYLPQLFRTMVEALKKSYGGESECPDLFREMINRGNYSARTAAMVREGYPVDLAAVKNFTNSVAPMMARMMLDINIQLKGVLRPFEFDPKKGVWKMNQKGLKEWIRETQDLKWWKKTDKGDVAISVEAWEKASGARHTYKDTVPDQMLRWFRFKQSLNGFLPPKKNRSSFWDYVGSDGRVRPYFGIFGSQSSRSQPAATGFIPLKAAWMRALIVPPKGKAICGIDYSSQEFLIAACLARDSKMEEAYDSGDCYIAFAKQAGAVPPNATKKSHPDIRDCYKSTVLGIQYEMGNYSLHLKIIADSNGKFFSLEKCNNVRSFPVVLRGVDGKKVQAKEFWFMGEDGSKKERVNMDYEMTPEKAQALIDSFYNTYRKLKVWKWKMKQSYKKDKYLKLIDGWTMFGDNQNPKSVGNFPVQGAGAAIMRRAVALAQDRGLKVIFTLHDAIYIEYDSHDFGAVEILWDCMLESFRSYFGRDIRMEAKAWSLDYVGPTDRITQDEKGKLSVRLKDGRVVEVEERHVDKRALEDYKKFQPYLESRQKTYQDVL